MLAVLPQKAAISRSDVSPQNWQDWRWQLRNMLNSLDDLRPLIHVSAREEAGMALTKKLFRVGVTPYYASLMDPDNEDCPIRRQAIPDPEEANLREEELRDPLGEELHSPVRAIFHKYPDRVLFLAIDRCAIYCRHCNRRRLVGGDEPPTHDELEQGFAYIEKTTRIRDVLISGGDPLLMSTSRLRTILARLRAIKHVEIIRIGTRVPVVLPMRIDDELCRMLREFQPLFINTHFNHKKELSPEAKTATARMVDHGILVGNQTVLLRGINSSVRSLRGLMRELIKNRIRPYYLFQGDTVLGTDHLRTPVSEAIALMDQMRGWMSGMAIPHLVLDAPAGLGKIPIGPRYIQEMDADWVTLRNYRGDTVRYPEPRQKDCAVPYDQVFFAEEPPDDDRVGSAEAG